jgi:hypothetical protein
LSGDERSYPIIILYHPSCQHTLKKIYFNKVWFFSKLLARGWRKVFNEFPEQITGRTPDEAQRGNVSSYPDKALL